MRRAHPILRAVNGISLRAKLFITYVALIVLLLGFLSVFTLQRVSSVLQDRILYSAQKSFEQTEDYLAEKIGKIVAVSKVVVTDSRVIALFDPEAGTLGITEKSARIYELSHYMASFKDTDLYDCYFYLPERNPFRTLSPMFLDLVAIDHAPWYEDFEESPSSSLLCPYDYFDPIETGQAPPVRVLTVLRHIKSTESLVTDLGVVRIDFKEAAIERVLELAASIPGSLVYIQTARGDTVASSDASLLEEFALPADAVADDGSGSIPRTYDLEGRSVFGSVARIPQTDWYLTAVIPYESVFSQIARIRQEMLVMIALTGLVTFLLASFLTYSMTRRLTSLSARMRSIGAGPFSSGEDSHDRDEIGILTRNFNEMLKTISELMEQRYEAGTAIKTAEMKLLQAQINPHFLYNTLDMIHWLALMNRSAEVMQAVNALSSFYKLGLSQGREEISIHDEIEHVRAYLQLQNMRYQNRIRLEISIDPGIEECLILKLTLQPLVENAILHGIMKKPSRKGTVSIIGVLDANGIRLEIQDDGIGMDPAQLEALKTPKRPEKGSHGFGIQNIQERMKLFYGEPYGLSIECVLPSGTRVRLRIPERRTTPV